MNVSDAKAANTSLTRDLFFLLAAAAPVACIFTSVVLREYLGLPETASRVVSGDSGVRRPPRRHQKSRLPAALLAPPPPEDGVGGRPRWGAPFFSASFAPVFSSAAARVQFNPIWAHVRRFEGVCRQRRPGGMAAPLPSICGRGRRRARRGLRRHPWLVFTPS
jgi:hypothetical protein